MIHFRVDPKHVACGFEPDGAVRAVSSTLHKLAVTCADCMLTPAFAMARQRIPAVRGGLYRG